MYLGHMSDPRAPAVVTGHLTRSGPPVATSSILVHVYQVRELSKEIPGIAGLPTGGLLLVTTGGPDLVRCPGTSAGASASLTYSRNITYNI